MGQSMAGAGVALAGALIPGPAWAQDAGGLAGPAPPPPPRTEAAAPTKRVDLLLSLHEAYDWADYEDTAPAAASDPHFRSTLFSAANAALRFSSTSSRVSFNATAASNIRHFSAFSSHLPSSHYGSLGLSAQLGRRVRAHASQRVSYAPYYSMGRPLTGAELTADDVLQPDHGLVRVDTFSAGSSAGWSWAAGERTSVNGSYFVDVVDTFDQGHGFLSQGVHADMSRRLTRYAQLRLGYGYRQADLAAGSADYDLHDLTSGFSYGRPLSASRRTFVGFSTGATIVAADRMTLVATGTATLTHQLARTWGTALSYNRAVAAYAGLSHPYLTDGISGSLNGLLSRRVGLSLSVGLTMGRAAVEIDNGFAAAFARGRLQYTFARYLPVFGEYVFYHTRFERPTGLSAGFPVFVRRHGVRAGLAYSLPLGRQER